MKKIIGIITIIVIFMSAEAQEFGKGLNFNNEKYKSVNKKAPLTRSLYTNIPESYSLKKYTPLPKNQGQYGTCVGWSTAYAGMTILEAENKKITNKETITANAFAPGFIYKQIKNDKDTWCQLGSSIADALEIMKTKGVCRYSDMTDINCPAYLSPSLFSKAANYKIKDYAKLFGMFDSDKYKISAVKKSLTQGNPVIIGMNTPKSFYSAKEEWIPSENSNITYDGHAMCVIGYNDKKYGGAFEIMNSWGTQWGNQGYIWISYENFVKFVKYAYEMIKFNNTEKKYEFYFAGKIEFKKADGKISPVTLENGIYKIKEPYKSGTLFRLYITNYVPAYVYAFGFDATKKTFTVFPHEKGISPALNYSENKVAIPDENHFIQTDNTTGEDYLCILYSKEKLDIEKIKKETENTYGSFKDRIYYVLNEKIVNPENIYMTENEIKFKVKKQNKSILAVITKTIHTN